MQPIKQLAAVLEGLADPQHYLFSLRDLSGVIPGQKNRGQTTLNIALFG